MRPLTDGLRRSESQGARSTVESGCSERPHRSQRGAQFVLGVAKQGLPGADCWTHRCGQTDSVQFFLAD